MNSAECKEVSISFLLAARDILEATKVEGVEMQTVRDMMDVAHLSVATAQVYATLATVLDPVDLSDFAP